MHGEVNRKRNKDMTTLRERRGGGKVGIDEHVEKYGNGDEKKGRRRRRERGTGRGIKRGRRMEEEEKGDWSGETNRIRNKEMTRYMIL